MHRDADVAAGPGRAVAVNQFQQRRFFLAGDGELTVQALQGVADHRHVGFRDLQF